MDAAEFETALNDAQPALRRRLGHDDAAVNAVNIRLWRRWKAGKLIRSIPAYALWLADRMKVDQIRAATRSRGAGPMFLGENDPRSRKPSPIQTLMHKDDCARAIAAVSELAQSQRRAIIFASAAWTPAWHSKETNNRQPSASNLFKARVNLKKMV